MLINHSQCVDTLLLPPSTTAAELKSYADSIRASIEYHNFRLRLRTIRGRIVSIVLTNSRPRLH